MARQTYYLDRAVRNPLYKTRMLQAGPIVLDVSAARLYRKLGVELLDEPKKLKSETISVEDAVRPAIQALAEQPRGPAKKAPAKRKRKAKAKPR